MNFSVTLSWLAPFANHIWQSTLFAGIAGLLTLALRKNHAQTRYWLWLVAAMKFLLPFFFLVAIGSYLTPSHHAPAQTLSYVMLQMSQPFPANAAVPSPRTIPPAILPWSLLAFWILGSTTVLLYWWVRWRRINVMQAALPIVSGREIQILRRVEQTMGIKPVRLLISKTTLEPGVLGIFRPEMLLPAGIPERLTDAQLEAIFVHELCHVRRRDNLAGALHMLVQSIFWFHPLVWWLGARLVEERERACDEEVVRLGSEAQAYAESILKVCEFYVESPLFCAAGVTGSNLKRRIEAIMNHRIAQPLGFGKKVLLTAAGGAALVAPIVIGLLNPTRSRAENQPTGSNSTAFESVSIAPSKVGDSKFFISTDSGKAQFTGFTVKELVKFAYNVNDSQISGGEEWVSAQRYDINAKAPGGNQLNFDQIKMDVQKMLADRFRLSLRREIKELTIYDLVADKSGSKLTEIHPGNMIQSRVKTNPPGHLEATEISMRDFARLLSHDVGHEVYNKTGLEGMYTFTLDWQPDSPDVANTLSAALQQQLGLTLESKTGLVEVIA